jgi:transcriptional regulator of acetoin/glycerol metabolism
MHTGVTEVMAEFGPRAIDPDTFAMALQLYQAQAGSVQSICSRLGIARRTFYRYVAT